MQIRFVLEKRKWLESSSSGGGTAVFNARIVNDQNQLFLETRNVIVGILNPDDINVLRTQFGGLQGVNENTSNGVMRNLRIPIYDADLGSSATESDSVFNREATQVINPNLWPLRCHFRGDPVVPGNFGTHGMVALLKASARDNFKLTKPIFKSLSKKSFSGMIFEDHKQIRFELTGIFQNDLGDVVAGEAALYLEDVQGHKLVNTPIYTFKKLTVTESLTNVG